ncbi:MAG: ImmA/IrrE family metallo-endopeptidase [Lachnospiraceae bacterium]|nr:ImmA/IrrE family metallo-endopeptidase [Lachnospiraceae bacterium]
MTYEDMLVEADDNNLITREKPLRAHKGRIKGERIAINNKLTEREKKCVLAEELGHYYTASGDILDQSSTLNQKQEIRGRVYAYNKLVGLMGIVDAYKNHCLSLSESAEYLEVTEDFLQDALSYYKSKYGSHVTIDNYVIFFEPTVAVLEMYN